MKIIQMKTTKILILALSILVLFTGHSYCDNPDFPKVGSLYRVVFAENGWSSTQYMDSSLLWVIKVDAISRINPNWILIEFPHDANYNLAHNSQIWGQRWLNLNYVVLLKPVIPGGGN
jgi:hypothetical protein